MDLTIFILLMHKKWKVNLFIFIAYNFLNQCYLNFNVYIFDSLGSIYDQEFLCFSMRFI